MKTRQAIGQGTPPPPGRPGGGRPRAAGAALAAALLLVLLAPSVSGAALGEPALGGEVGLCLGCHGKPGIIKFFENSETVEAYVDPETFGRSVHKFECSRCHRDFSETRHPSGKYRSLRQFRSRASLECRKCHKDVELARTPVHAGLLDRENGGPSPVCTDCHGAHSIAPVKGSRMFSSEERYCLSCHAGDVSIDFRDGDTASARVDMMALKGSAHRNLCCSDCHFGFSSEDHPRRNFRSRRDLTLALSETCRRCHFDKYTKTLESIHFAVLNQGNLDAPVCIDCHGGHDIGPVHVDRTAGAEKCRKCHAGIYQVYASSVHGDALINELNTDVPVCASCHKAHDITDPFASEYHEKIPEMCGGCHADEAVMGRYGLSTDVLKTYLSDFHGVTLRFYKRQKDGEAFGPSKPTAVCTDCHGTHNIASAVGPAAGVLKENLLERCRKCHADATANFPDAWLSHYVPSLERAPLVYLVNLAYKIFIPLMVIGLLLHILLHIWRYIVDR